MYVHHPEIAKRFEAETPKGAKLPEHVSDGEPVHKRIKAEIMKRMMPPKP